MANNADKGKTGIHGFVVNQPSFDTPKRTIQRPLAARQNNADVHYDLPKPSKEIVARINANSPKDSDLEILEA